MLKYLKTFYGKKMHANDGIIGHVNDFYFDDRNWKVRYVVADTGDWLAGRKVLLSPHAFLVSEMDENNLQINLTKSQLENSPSIDTHKPVSRQYEEQYHHYYGWPNYWQIDGLGTTNAFPILAMPMEAIPNHPGVITKVPEPEVRTHLRSARAIEGYQLQAHDKVFGHLSDLVMDTATWFVPQIVIKTSWLSSLAIEMPTRDVLRISYEDSTVFVDSTVDEIKRSPKHGAVTQEAAQVILL